MFLKLNECLVVEGHDENNRDVNYSGFAAAGYCIKQFGEQMMARPLCLACDVIRIAATPYFTMRKRKESKLAELNPGVLE